ncbi:MAG: acyltransferase family protein [Clostridia bacterium]|nr:acyltransferase family protein [Candidatus Limimonas egerieequi]MCQ2489518.1 acyltransferase family protein [Clostridia bacterium]
MGKERVFLWDNVKTLLIILVVMGHFVTQYTGSNEIMQSMFCIIYSFHMPLFIFVSGLFAKSSFKDDKLKVNKIISYLILYVALKLIIFIERISFGHDSTFTIWSESGIPWYMLAMAAWICMTYCLRFVKPWALLSFSTALALVAGYSDKIGDVLCLSRIIVFYPFFLLGFYMDSKVIAEKTRDPWRKAVAALILVALIVLGFLAREELYQFRPIMVARNPYSQLANPAFGALYRAAWYALSLCISLSVVCILPNKENKLSYIGASTLPIYFIHRPILYILMDVGFGALVMDNLGPVYGPIVFLLSAIVLALVLSIPVLNKPFNALMKVKYTGLLKED